MLRAIFIAFSLLVSSSALAVNPDEVLKDPALETRAQALSTELRCLVCQNQSIDDSDTPLAKDLHVLLQERLKAAIRTIRSLNIWWTGMESSSCSGRHLAPTPFCSGGCRLFSCSAVHS